MNPCPIEALLALADETGADWLREAVEDHLHGEPLEVALGLSGAPGKPTARRRYWRRRRDRYLRTAWEAVSGAIGPWDRTLRLAAPRIGMAAKVFHSELKALLLWTIRQAPAEVAPVVSVQMPLAEVSSFVSRAAEPLGDGHFVKR